MTEEKQFVRFRTIEDQEYETMVSIDETKIAIGAGSEFRAEMENGITFTAEAGAAIKRGSRIKVERHYRGNQGYWLAYPLTPLTETDKKIITKENRVKTMYDNHKDRDGNEIPIFGMRDSHLQNMIRFTALDFVKQRDAMTKNISHADPAIAAMATNIGWDAKEVAGRTRAILERLNPYLQEAGVRGGSCAETATTALRAITNRSARVEMSPTKIVDEPVLLEWDSVAGDDPLQEID